MSVFFLSQTAATEEKTILEEAQRSDANERKVKCEEWVPKYFAQVSLGNCFIKYYSYLYQQMILEAFLFFPYQASHSPVYELVSTCGIELIMGALIQLQISK